MSDSARASCLHSVFMTNALALAADPRTPSKRLLALSKHSEPTVRAAVAANANTPIKGLLALLDEFPAVVLGNAALALALLDDMRLFLRAPRELQIAWAGNAAMPPWLLAQLADVPQEQVLRSNLASNPSTPVETLERLAFPQEFDDDDDGWNLPELDVLNNAALSDGLRYDVLYMAMEGGLDFDSIELSDEVLQMFEESYGLSVDDGYNGLAGATDGDASHVWCMPIAENNEDHPDREDDACALLFRDGCGSFLQAVERDGVAWGLDEQPALRVEPDWSGEDLRSLWGSTALELAAHPATAPWVARRLARHADATVRAAVASHPALTASELVALAQDPDPRVRHAAARNPRMPVTALMWLGQDESGEIRAAVASNPSTCEVTLARLAQDRRPSVRSAASQNTRRQPSQRGSLSSAA